MVVLLLVHMLLAVALIGAVTHQAAGVLAPTRAGGSFLARFRAVDGAGYVNAIILLYLLTATLGLVIYPNYRIGARVVMEELRMFAHVGSFELKEHLIALGLGLLPVYWWSWRRGGSDHLLARRIVTALLALIVWYGFLAGHILNNTRGIT
jgi:hypothetical protein